MRMNTFYTKFIFSIILCMAAMTAAAANVVLSGRVTDGDNAPVEFATVRIGGTAIGATTDLGGKYTLTVPQADTITVIFSCMGYTEVTERLIKPKGNVTLNARLRKKTLELEGLEVTEYKRQTGQMQTIDIGAARLTPDASGGSIEAVGCVFDQSCLWRGWQIMVRDWLAHIGQSWNDEGLRGLLRPANWLPGVCRGLVATAGGQVRAENCHATRWWIRLEGHRGPRMSRNQAQALMARLEGML